MKPTEADRKAIKQKHADAFLIELGDHEFICIPPRKAEWMRARDASESLILDERRMADESFVRSCVVWPSDKEELTRHFEAKPAHVNRLAAKLAEELGTADKLEKKPL